MKARRYRLRNKGSHVGKGKTKRPPKRRKKNKAKKQGRQQQNKDFIIVFLHSFSKIISLIFLIMELLIFYS